MAKEHSDLENVTHYFVLADKLKSIIIDLGNATLADKLKSIIIIRQRERYILFFLTDSKTL